MQYHVNIKVQIMINIKKKYTDLSKYFNEYLLELFSPYEAFAGNMTIAGNQ